LYRLITGQHSPPRYFPKYTSAVKAWFGVARRGTLSRGLAWQAWTAQETGPFSFALLGYANYYIAKEMGRLIGEALLAKVREAGK
jgi:hypothetical protein